MKEEIQRLHLQAALLAGKDRSCGKKVDYKSFERADEWANILSAQYGKEMEAYPCPFCEGWHIGRKMPMDLLLELAKGS